MHGVCLRFEAGGNPYPKLNVASRTAALARTGRSWGVHPTEAPIE